MNRLIAFLENEYGIQADISDLQGVVEHVFTHLVWNISVFFGKVKQVSDTSEPEKSNERRARTICVPGVTSKNLEDGSRSSRHLGCSVNHS